MVIKTRSYAELWTWLATFLIMMVLNGCSTIKLVGDYDEHIDQGVTQLQKDVETFLVKLEASAEKPADRVESYDKNIQFYNETKVAISSLRIRADSMERNSITVRMLDRLAKNISRLEGMHREGLAKAEIDESIRGGLNAQFTAILTFELAKRRGEKLDDAKAQSPTTPKSAG
jgi:hypothetical protein